MNLGYQGEDVVSTIVRQSRVLTFCRGALLACFAHFKAKTQSCGWLRSLRVPCRTAFSLLLTLTRCVSRRARGELQQTSATSHIRTDNSL